MKDTSENYPPSRQAERPPTTNDRPHSTRHGETRPLTNAQQTQSADRPGMRLTSLSALYQPAFKPYSFSHMYSTKYNADFEGRYMPPPLPIRVSTANYAPIKYKFGSSTYQQHFQERKPFPTAFVIPYSRHRCNNPQPNMVNSYNYPDGTRWIWNPSTSSGGNVTKAESQHRSQTQSKPRYHRWYSR
ncbi:hypothetical protein ACROYT_G018355 [Oculina patagonica]